MSQSQSSNKVSTNNKGRNVIVVCDTILISELYTQAFKCD